MPTDEPHLIFERRRQADPQGVIDDLIAQTARQGGKIAELQGTIRTVVGLVKEAFNDGVGCGPGEADAAQRIIENRVRTALGLHDPKRYQSEQTATHLIAREGGTD